MNSRHDYYIVLLTFLKILSWNFPNLTLEAFCAF